MHHGWLYYNSKDGKKLTPEQSKRTDELHHRPTWSKRTQTTWRPDRRAVWFLQKYSVAWRKSKRNGMIGLVQGQESARQVQCRLKRTRSGWSQNDTGSRLQDSGQKAGACDLCYYLVQEFYIRECINYWWDNLFSSYFGLNYIHLYIPTFFVHPRRKWNWAGQFLFARHTLGAAYAAWQLHSRTPEWMSLTCEKKTQMSPF